MLKKTGALFFLFFYCLVLLCGCQTTNSTKTAAADDTEGGKNFIQVIDDWIKDNLW